MWWSWDGSGGWVPAFSAACAAMVAACSWSACREDLREVADRRAGQGFLLPSFDFATTEWVKRFSLFAIAPLRPAPGRSVEHQQWNRDVFVLVMVGLSFAGLGAAAATSGTYSAEFTCRCLATYACYRVIDLSVVAARAGVLLNFRGDVKLSEEPLWRVQRVLAGVLLNYLEIVNLFTLIYLYLGMVLADQFRPAVSELHQAFHVSMATLTTVGYGLYAPDGMLSGFLVLIQACLGVILLAGVVAGLVSLGASRPEGGSPGSGSNRREWPNRLLPWIVPPLSAGAVVPMIYWVLEPARLEWFSKAFAASGG